MIRYSRRIARQLLILGLLCLAPGDALLADVTTLTRVRANGDITVAPNGNIYIADFGRPAIGGGSSVVLIKPDGSESLFVDNLDSTMTGTDIDSNGNLILAAFNGNAIYRIDPNGNPTLLARPVSPVGVVVDGNDVIYIVQCNLNRVSRVNDDGSTTVIARGDGLNCPNGIDIGHDGALYVVNFANGDMLRVGLDGTVTPFASIPGAGNGHVVFVNNRYYVTGRLANRVYEVDRNGNVEPYAGSGVDGNQDGPNLQATISRPNGIGASPDGRFLYINGSSDPNATDIAIRRIDLNPEDNEPVFSINAGLSGSWFNPSTDGQGLFIDVIPAQDEMFISWFTYLASVTGNDAVFGSADHDWFVASGSYENDTASLVLLRTEGGVLDNPAAVTESQVGSLTLIFSSCTEATMTYSFENGGPSGEISLIRLTPDELCTIVTQIE